MSYFVIVLITLLAVATVANAVYAYTQFVAHNFWRQLKGKKGWLQIFMVMFQVVGCVGILFGAMAYGFRMSILDTKGSKKPAVVKVEKVQTRPVQQKTNPPAPAATKPAAEQPQKQGNQVWI